MMMMISLLADTEINDRTIGDNEETRNMRIAWEWRFFDIPGNWLLKFENEEGTFIYFEPELLLVPIESAWHCGSHRLALHLQRSPT
jgi:hypothetical protein